MDPSHPYSSATTPAAMPSAISYLDWISYYSRNQLVTHYPTTMPVVPGYQAAPYIYPAVYYVLPTPTVPLTPLSIPVYPIALIPTPPSETLFPVYPAPQVSPVTPAPPIQSKIKEEKKSHVCSNCASTKTCQWRNVTKSNVLCNACFVYQNRHKKTRPFQSIRKKAETSSHTKKADTSSN